MIVGVTDRLVLILFILITWLRANKLTQVQGLPPFFHCGCLGRQNLSFLLSVAPTHWNTELWEGEIGWCLMLWAGGWQEIHREEKSEEFQCKQPATAEWAFSWRVTNKPSPRHNDRVFSLNTGCDSTEKGGKGSAKDRLRLMLTMKLLKTDTTKTRHDRCLEKNQNLKPRNTKKSVNPVPYWWEKHCNDTLLTQHVAREVSCVEAAPTWIICHHTVAINDKKMMQIVPQIGMMHSIGYQPPKGFKRSI